jgi:hypothetical protein
MSLHRITADKLGAKHNNGRRGRRLHVICDRHRIGTRSWGYLVGLEGWGIKCDGWWYAWHIRVLR